MPDLPVLVNTEFRQRAGRTIRSPWNWMDDLMDRPPIRRVDDGHFQLRDFDPHKYAATFKDAWDLRQEHIATYGFAVLNEAAIHALLPLGPWLEIGAGAAYWSHELQRAGCDALATDPYPPGSGRRDEDAKHYSLGDKTWTKVLPLPASTAVKLYPNRNLLTVWPSYDEPWAGAALKLFTGRYVAYVGEGDGGCTADDAFHDHLEKNFAEVDDITIPQFFGIHDRLMIYKRKPLHQHKRLRAEDVPAEMDALVEA